MLHKIYMKHLKVGDLVRRGPTVIWGPRFGIVIRDLRCGRYMVFFFDTNSQYNMDKRLLEVISESR